MKLTHLRVIDLSVYLPGPYLTLALADHGTEVIKIEPPGGDPLRRMAPLEGADGVAFRLLNRGKQSVVLDLKQQSNRDALLNLCESADVFVESFRPGVMQRLGVGYEEVRKRNPRIVYCSITAYGQTGPYRDRPAHDLALEAITGVTSMTVTDEGLLAFPGVPMSDYLAALQGLSGVLMALLRREQTGTGDYIDIGMHEATLAALVTIVGPAMAENRQPIPSHEGGSGGLAFYQIYATQDDRYLALAGSEAKFTRALLEKLGRMDLFEVCMSGPGPAQHTATACLRQAFMERTLEDWIGILHELGICFAPVNTIPEALRDPHVMARNMVLTDHSGRGSLAPPIRFSSEPARPRLQAPLLGEHTDTILSGIRCEES